MPTEAELRRRVRRFDAQGRPIANADLAGIMQHGERAHVPMMFVDGSQQPAQARPMIFDYADPRTYPGAVQGSPSGFSDAAIQSEMDYAARCRELAYESGYEQNSSAEVNSAPVAVRAEVQRAIREHHIANAWRGEEEDR